MTKRVLVTGGPGFIGHHLVEHLLLKTDWELVCMDRLDCSGTLHRVHEVLESHPQWKSRMSFVFHDLKAEINSLRVSAGAMTRSMKPNSAAL